MIVSSGYAATDASLPLVPYSFNRRDVGPRDILIDIDYCGICHTDLHMARNEWGVSRYPLVPGHEIVGRVRDVGKEVTRFQPGDLAGVGVMVGSCRQCSYCTRGDEQYCAEGLILTYNGEEKYIGGVTYGGYADTIVVDDHFAVGVPAGLDLAAVAPLLCAGVTTWSPLKHWKAGPGVSVGVVGLGGLGHMAVKFARALGAEVTLFTRSPGKVADGERLGAHRVIVSTDAAAMAQAACSIDVIIDCVAAPHDLDAYLATLRVDGSLVLAGIPEAPHDAPAVTPMVLRRLSVAGTSIGSMRETEEMLAFCAEHGIVADIEMVRPTEIENAFQRMLKGDVKYRFVIDIKG